LLSTDWPEIIRVALEIASATRVVDPERGTDEAEMPPTGLRPLLNELLALVSTGLSEFANDKIVGLVDSLRNLQPALSLSALEEYRALLCKSWSSNTVYPETVSPTQWVAGDSSGQCGVTSAWLAKQLNSKYSICSTFCRGFLVFDTQQAENLFDHCWLEFNGESGEEMILDLTCGQARGFNREIVFNSKADLANDRIQYISCHSLSISDLPNNPVWPRYQKLLLNMAA
jgi:hypothetical protein